ncbi:MAG: 16S rRNA processing protein RimM [Saprospiraceae bacterium]|nr:16S rRNA processing protein RimM [Saprospiraceae bacterium]MBK7790233.1 16S rRNA processing protein RimM [Saprospiraceae bacterium]
MERPQYVAVGKVMKPFGNQGQVLLGIHDTFADLIPETGYVYLYVDGSYLPFFITSWEGDSDVLVKLEEVDNPESASRLSGKTLYLNQDEIPEELMDSPETWGDLVGFTAYNEEVLLGPICEILDYPAQKLLKIVYDKKEVLVPLVEDFIVSIDTKARKIVLKIHQELINL